MLLAACLVLPSCVAPAMEQFFSRGVAFSGITLAITAPEGDPVPALLEQLLPGMEDVSQYCQVRAMDREAAVESLEQGDVTAVLVLPEGFIQGILEGRNPSVELIVPADRPLEAMLTLWVGQSAADLLASVQSAVYAVLDLYAQNQPEALDYNQVVTQINLRFINWTLSRQEMFQVEQLVITDSLPIGLHYGYSLLSFLLLSMTPFFFTLYESEWIRSQRRLRSLGIPVWNCWLSSATACWLLQFAILLPACCILGKGNFWLCVAASGLSALFGCGFTVLCCSITGHIGSCGLTSTLSALVFLVLSGGILPPVMLPKVLRASIAHSPVTWMRSIMAWHEPDLTPTASHVILLICVSVVMLGLSCLAYGKRFMKEVPRK